MMRFLLYVLFGLGALMPIHCCYSQPINSPDSLILKRHVEVLCTDSLEGRGVGSLGVLRAGDYIKSCFLDYGLSPLGASYCNGITFYTNEGRNAKVRFVSNGNEFAFGRDFFFEYIEDSLCWTDTKGKTIKARLVFEPEEPFNDSDTCIAVFTPKKGSIIDRCRQLNAKFYIYIEGNDTVLAYLNDNPIVLGNIALKPVAGSVNAVSSFFFSLSSGAKLLGVSPERMSRIVKGEPFRFRTRRPQLVEFSVERKELAHEECNIVGQVAGSDNAAGCVMVSAHYDHLGKSQSAIFPGADDNASGVAVMLEVARLFSQARMHGMVPKRSVAFVAFTGEEMGTKGSYSFVNNPPIPLKSIKLLVNLDMVGHRKPKELGENAIYLLAYDSLARQRSLFVDVNSKGQYLNLNLSLDNPKRAPYLLALSDQAPFLKAGVPALMFCDGPVRGFHSPNDIPANLDYNKMANLSKLLFDAIWHLCNEQ